VACGHEAQRNGGWSGGERGPLAVVCDFAASGLAEQIRPNSDDLDDHCPVPKRGGDYCSIGLLDPIWYVVEKGMVAQLSVIKLHDCLHGGLPRRGTGTTIMEVKLQQQLAWVDQEPLYQIYLGLRKAYDALDWERCLKILAGYDVRPNLLCLQEKFWKDAKMVCRACGNYGLSFEAHRRVTQGGGSFQPHVQCLF
jgi:hypothetical protein